MNGKCGCERKADGTAGGGRSKGQSLVEFALSLVILLILVAGIFDGARALFTYLSMRDAAQEGALFASIEPGSDTEIHDRTCAGSNLVQDMCDGGNVDIQIDYSGDQCMDGSNSVTVTIVYPHFQLAMPFIGAAVGDNEVPISASIIDTIIAPSCGE